MNVLYPKFKESILQAGINLSSVTVKALLVDTSLYTYSASHQFLSDIASGARVASSAALASKTFTNGVFDAADTTFTGPPASKTCAAIVFYVDTGTAGTSALIQYQDDIAVVAAAIVAGGTVYSVNDVLTVSGGTSTTTAQLTVTSVSSGVITGVSVSRPGAYSVLPSNPVSVTGGGGTGATFTLSWDGLPITTSGADVPLAFDNGANRIFAL